MGVPKTQQLRSIRRALLQLCPLLLAGCAVFHARPQKYETVSAELSADTERAAELNQRAIDAIQNGETAVARELVEKALIADVNHAPSHNTLGQICFQEGNYYLAAWEFEFAMRLSPSQAEYYNNLGLVLEAADRFSEAAEQYASALELSPHNYEFISNYTRCRIRQGEVSPETKSLLEQVALHDPRPDWKDWARQHLSQQHLNVPGAVAWMSDGLPDESGGRPINVPDPPVKIHLPEM